MSLHVIPPLPMATQGLAFATPLEPRPLEGEQNAGPARATPCCAGCACFTACCVCACAGWRWEDRPNAFEGAEATNCGGRRGRRGCWGRAWMGKVLFPRKRKEVGITGRTHCPFGGSQKELLQVFPFYMVKSLDTPPPHRLRHARNISKYFAVAARGAVMIIS